jgi:hypothetical protein
VAELQIGQPACGLLLGVRELCSRFLQQNAHTQTLSGSSAAASFLIADRKSREHFSL